ncbi:MAG: SurA N-terminal domain-containing protein, partial [Intestinibacter sp.]|uniref:SurA N-terminal domain-containing protein n=1 Tax=Intestinibacter sp. TaxID=1965304 RepID=UPI003F16CAF1
MDENEKRERKIMKKIALVFALIGVIGGAFYGGMEYGRLLPASHRYYSNSQVYATIDGEKITGKDLKTVMEPIFYSNGLQKLSDSEISSYESTMLEYLVNMEVLYKEAEENNIEVTDDQVQQNYDQTISSINSEYNLTEEEYLDKFNLTEDKLKERIKKELM